MGVSTIWEGVHGVRGIITGVYGTNYVSGKYLRQDRVGLLIKSPF